LDENQDVVDLLTLFSRIGSIATQEVTAIVERPLFFPLKWMILPAFMDSLCRQTVAVPGVRLQQQGVGLNVPPWNMTPKRPGHLTPMYSSLNIPAIWMFSKNGGVSPVLGKQLFSIS